MLIVKCRLWNYQWSISKIYLAISYEYICYGISCNLNLLIPIGPSQMQQQLRKLTLFDPTFTYKLRQSMPSCIYISIQHVGKCVLSYQKLNTDVSEKNGYIARVSHNKHECCLTSLQSLIKGMSHIKWYVLSYVIWIIYFLAFLHKICHI